MRCGSSSPFSFSLLPFHFCSILFFIRGCAWAYVAKENDVEVTSFPFLVIGSWDHPLPIHARCISAFGHFLSSSFAASGSRQRSLVQITALVMYWGLSITFLSLKRSFRLVRSHTHFFLF
ncbi:hypothetical protein, unlikely [Trypanosoma brucei gambiense DAL972]|uniref:Uncharacterized protein n=1 Tax=Trypanosoma brucei gambiense (strain MHOM/CI/86/DAL972) TaxID=679716 RepID=C9ZT83_TRYB9|nr:hypothetical protein, unlikely [Trypanosoma brucei gambiense DAL972]CBH12618.1 hypothetical protein, unlikely [Trypanosoma brucei gambiense DAL972]|eukprot:XP_011774898.1 hypothetical protein, unlikely [Trypanosoma brucei gambiense DAL972]